MDIIAQLKEKRDQFDAAIRALSGETRNVRHAPKGAASTNGRRKKRKLSKAARAKISVAARARWAKAKKSVRNRL